MQLNVKNTTLPSLQDLIAPHSCRGCNRTGKILCECCKNNLAAQTFTFCPNCKTKNKTGKCKKCKLPPIFVVGERNSLLGTLIHDFKYNSVRALAKPLAELLDRTLPNLPENTVIVPLPTATHHIRARALDHTYNIAKHLAKLRGLKVEKLLLRTKNTVQVGSDEKTRLKQAASAFELNETLKIDNSKTYLLIDDVWTTGASMKAAIKKLRAGRVSKIIVGILAVNSLN